VGGASELDLAVEKINDPEPLVRVAAIEAAGEILARSQELAPEQASFFIPMITRHFDDPEWPVQETILSMMERFRSRDSIPILIEFVERITSRPEEYRERILQRVLEVLRSLTGAQIQETDPSKWREWWSEREETFRMAPAPPPILQGFQLDGPSFFNIPVNSDCVYFILDISGSMKAPLSSQEELEADRAESKLDRARAELEKTLNALSSDVYFNIILFNETVRQFSEKPLQATEEAKRAAGLFFQEAHADEGTNIFDSLNRALEIKSLGLVNRIGEKVELDTVFLLSDGVPTSGAVIDPSEILRIITRANRLTKIRIHTVYLGSDPSSFMRELAGNNYGRYIQVR